MTGPPHRTTRRPGPRSSRVARSPTAPPAPVRREQFETLRSDFDEAALHVAQRREFTGFRIGPVLDVRMGEVPPGTVGWRRRVEWSPSRGARAAPDGEPDAWLFLLVVPSSGSTSDGAELATPPEPNAFESRTRCGTSPPSLLVARAQSEVGGALLKRFADAVCLELESDD
jgi:hypothetical protein